MRATDALLTELARRAGVRPPHIFHLAVYRKAMGVRFSAEGYAAFALMDLRHVVAMLAVLDDLPPEKPRAPRQSAARSVLAPDWVVPDEWLLIARERRFWPLDVCRTEAERFADWHRMKGIANADWKAAWRNWIDKSNREDGSLKSVSGQFENEEAKRAYLAKLR